MNGFHDCCAGFKLPACFSASMAFPQPFDNGPSLHLQIQFLHRFEKDPIGNIDPIPIENIHPIETFDPVSTAVAQILEIIPNVEPAHLLQLIETYLYRDHDNDGGEGAAAGERVATDEEQVQEVVRHVLHLLFENPDYPKADLRASGKRKGVVGDPDDGDYLEGLGKGKILLPRILIKSITLTPSQQP